MVFPWNTCKIVFLLCNHQSPFSENVLPCFSSVTHTMWALCLSRGWIWNCCRRGPDAGFWMGRMSSRLRSPPSLNEWMARSGLVLAGVWWWCWWWWWWCWYPWTYLPPLQRSQRRKRTRSVEDDEEGHLIYHNGDMLRARCIEYIPLFSLYFFLFCFSCICGGMTLSVKTSIGVIASLKMFLEFS